LVTTEEEWKFNRGDRILVVYFKIKGEQKGGVNLDKGRTKEVLSIENVREGIVKMLICTNVREHIYSFRCVYSGMRVHFDSSVCVM